MLLSLSITISCGYRGPGELFGYLQSGQSGLLNLSVEEMMNEGPLMAEAHNAAAQVLRSNGGQIPQNFQTIMKALGLESVQS